VKRLIFLICLLFAVPAFGFDAISSWDTSSEADVTKYKVYFFPNITGPSICTGFTPKEVLIAQDEDPGALRVQTSIYGIPSGCKYAVVTAIDVDGYESEPSATVKVRPLPPSNVSVQRK
jgi:hypothetical protein